MPDIVAGVVGILALCVWVYCLFDVATTHEALMRNLPKVAWFVVVLLLFDVGALLWLCFGRPRGRRPATTAVTWSASAASAPPRHHRDGPALDDLHPIVREREERARMRMLQAQLERWENELRRHDRGGAPGT